MTRLNRGFISIVAFAVLAASSLTVLSGQTPTPPANGQGAAAAAPQQPAPAPAPAPRPPRPLEQLAYDAAITIADPAKEAAALKSLLENAQFKVHGIARQAQNSLFTLLVTKLPERTDDINAILDAMIASLDGTPAPSAAPAANGQGANAAPANPVLTDAVTSLERAVSALQSAAGGPAARPPAAAPAPATPMSRLNSVTGWATSLVDANILLDRAASMITPALAAMKFDDYASSTKASMERVKATNPNVTVPTEAQMKTTFESNRGRALEVLGRIHLAQKRTDEATQEFTAALAANPSAWGSDLGLAQIDAGAGRDASALDHYLSVAISGHMKPKDDAAMAALFKKVRGPGANLDAALDTLYRTKFPNPIKETEYVPVANHDSRVVLAELFTGSGCGPCVAADLAMDSLMDRYPAKDVIFVAYHANIPQPDPMVVAGADARRTFYAVPGVPTIRVDGTEKVGGGGRDAAQENYGDYITMIDKALAAPATAQIALTSTRAASAVTVHVNVSGLPADVKEPRLHILIGERELHFSGENGIRFHRMVVRAVAGEKSEDGSGFALTPGAAKTIDHVFDLKAIPADLTKTLAAEMVKRRKTETTAGRPPGDYRAEGHAMTDIDPNALFVVAYVQDANKKVLQAAKIDLGAAPKK